MANLGSAPRTHFLDRPEWRAWLSANHADTPAVWMVSWKATTGRPRISHDDAVSEALAFGCVDSLPGRLDDERTTLYFSRRKPTSAWSRPNKNGYDTHASAAGADPKDQTSSHESGAA